MIERFTVRSFKSLVDVSIDLGLVNVFIGSNGSGKSNLLEALGVMAAAAAGKVTPARLKEHGVRPGLPQLFKASFKGARTSPEIRFGATGNGCSYEVGLFAPMDQPSASWRFHTELLTLGRRKLLGRSHHSQDRLDPESGLAALKLVELAPSSPAARLIKTLQSYGVYSPGTDFLRGTLPDPTSRSPIGLRGGGLPDAFSSLIRHVHMRWRQSSVPSPALEPQGLRDDLDEMIDWADDYAVRLVEKAPLAPSVPSERSVLLFRDRYMARKRNTLTGYDASEGALFVLFNAVMALHPLAPPLAAIDNADHGLNPRLARRLMECMCTWTLAFPEERQLLLTTHNPLVLDGLPLRDSRVRLFTVDRSSKGHTTVNPVVLDDRLRTMADEGWTLSRLWVMGHLGGGVPNV